MLNRLMYSMSSILSNLCNVSNPQSHELFVQISLLLFFFNQLESMNTQHLSHITRTHKTRFDQTCVCFFLYFQFSNLPNRMSQLKIHAIWTHVTKQMKKIANFFFSFSFSSETWKQNRMPSNNFCTWDKLNESKENLEIFLVEEKNRIQVRVNGLCVLNEINPEYTRKQEAPWAKRINTHRVSIEYYPFGKTVHWLLPTAA